MRNKLDFIVIGAAKAGTTTLFELIKDHPHIFVPGAKEVPFFSNNKLYKKGVDWYFKSFFSGSAENHKKGTITPQYMLGENHNTPRKIASRIKKHNPDVKLVAILRAPIERSYSHYQMFKQRGHFKADFYDAVDNVLNDTSIELYRKGDKKYRDDYGFLIGSEYGRILNEYLKEFNRSQLLVLFTEDLKTNPEKVLKQLFGFLGVDQTYLPANIGKEFRKGGSNPKVKILTPGVLFKIPFLKLFWSNIVPYSIRKRIEYRINLWNIRPGQPGLNKNSIQYERLLKFFEKDKVVLKSLTPTTPPWDSKI